MTRRDYLNKRNPLMEQAQRLIDAGEIDKANEKMKEIKELDATWETIAEAQADFRAMQDNQPMYNVRDFRGVQLDESNVVRGEVINLVNGNTYYPGAVRVADPLFLSDSRSMVDYAKENSKAADPLMLEENALGDVVRGMVTGVWSSNELKNAVTTSTTGTLIPEVLSARVIDLARNLSLFTAAKVPTVPMSSNNMTISRLTEDPVFAFKQEGEEGAEVGISIDGVKLEAHTVYGYCYVSLEAIQSSQNLTGVLRNAFAQAVAQAIDNGMLYGQDDGSGGTVDYAPSGIMNDSDIISLEATNTGYDDFVKASAAIKQSNYVASTWAVNAYTDETLSLLKDSEGRYLDAPAVLSGMSKIVSNQLAYDAENGSDGLVFDPQSMLIGIQDSIKIRMIEDEKAVKNGLIAFRVHAMLDCKVITPKAICRITGLK
ncbi:MAG: phage major capsid protein [Lachnospiraceae bacterium]|nr:phage major capsid protein [Lachnospiraceae bacterium]